MQNRIIRGEKNAMQPGCLVETTNEIHTVPFDHDNRGYESLPQGTVGIIIDRPNSERPRQYLVNFVGGETYWMYCNEIQPYMGTTNV